MDAKKELYVCSPNEEFVRWIIERAFSAGYDVYILGFSGKAASDAGDALSQIVAAESPSGEGAEKSSGVIRRKRVSAGDSIAALVRCWKSGMSGKELRAAAGVSSGTYGRIRSKLPQAMRDQLAEVDHKLKYRNFRDQSVATSSGKKGKVADIVPKNYTKEEKAERVRRRNLEHARTSSFLNDKNSIF